MKCRLRLGARGEICDDNPGHGHHRTKCIVAVVAIEALECTRQRCGPHLSAHAPAVLAPSAHAFGSIIVDDGIPDLINLVLGVTGNLKTDGLRMSELWTVIECGEGFFEEFEFDRQHRSAGRCAIAW